MLFITASNLRMKDFVLNCVRSLESFGYKYQVYNLGGLDFGIDYIVEDQNFQEKGIYWQLPDTDHIMKRETKSMFKPLVMKDARQRFPNETLVWLDADTVLLKPFEFKDGEYDIGVAKRPDSEAFYEQMGDDSAMDRLGRYNAGMIIFKPTNVANTFLDLWATMTIKYANDQIGLNQALKKHTVTLLRLHPMYNFPKQTERTILYHMKGQIKEGIAQDLSDDDFSDVISEINSSVELESV